MDENADRAQVHGQQPVPERDIEPLWPPDPTDQGAGKVVPPWAAVAEQRTAPPPVASGPVTPPVAAPPINRPPVPGQPGAAPLPPPSPSDYPSLSGAVPPPGAWGPGAGSGWAPAQASWPPPADPPAASTPTGPPGTDGTPQAGDPPANDVVPGGVDLDLPFTLDRPTAAGTSTDRAAGADTPAGPAGADTPAGRGSATGRAPADSPPTAPAPSADGSGDDASAVAAAGRPANESPWAYPPQRPAGAPSHDEPAATTPPIPAPPGPHPGVTHAGPDPAGPSVGPAIPGQVSPASIPPPPDLTRFGNPPQQAPQPAAPPGPYPPSPGWYPPPWQQGTPGAPPGQPYQEAEGVTRVPATGYPDTTGYPDASWTPESTPVPTAEDFSRRRQVRPADPVATMGVRAVVNKMGLLRLSPGRHEQELKRDIEMVRRNFGGLRQVTVVNPKGGAGKTVAILLLAMTFGQKRGGYVLAWDNNETQGTLGMRAQQDFHSRTVRDMLRDLGQFQGAHGRVGDLSQYVRSQGEGMFDVLASDESATGGEMLTAAAFAEIREVVSRFYKLIFVDTGNNVRAQNWQASMDATDQLVVTMSARNDSAETAARMLDHLEQSGRQRLVRQAVTVVSMPPSRKEIDLPAIQEHFAARTRAVLLAPYERLIDTGEPIRYGGLSSATRDAWLKIAAAVAEGL
ncbi:chromosome partitioning protein [Micromonospora sp. WMMD961]|uniref:MinD/ParA family ATP-binding protein n=1 Tax=Micromonospora sp. WMMD961 TaxID=3016100 RepID=UPI0024167BB7|nr:chromosome partitioning protein [Micromonospora sp. WMMD961]MDG4778463.1 chromosome partitioning protein [Micromonospora sp. WMMD961]